MNATVTQTDAIAVNEIGGLCLRVMRMIEQQVGALENEPEDGAFSEQRVKALQLLTKTLQAMEEVAQKQEKANDGRDAGPGDILEFRKELERHIEALGAGEDDAAVC